jgi:DNA-binding NarL/FixJ family response regulator
VQVHRELKPDVTLMDLQMPDISGLDVIIAIRSEGPAARIIVLTTYSGMRLRSERKRWVPKPMHSRGWCVRRY